MHDRSWWKHLAILCLVLPPLAACDDGGEPKPIEPPPVELEDIELGVPGSLVQESGKGGFAFGAATAATQIEDANDRTDWYYWTLPVEEGGRGQGKGHVADAVGTFSNPEFDLNLIKDLGLDDYRFSIEWARVEPERGVIDEEALTFYSDFIDALLEMGVRPNVSIYHFSNPIWVFGEAMDGCGEEGPTDTNLCGWDHAEGVELIIEALTDHAALLADRFGDRVDNWVTFNEPMNYIIAAYGIGYFPPGRNYLVGAILDGGGDSPAFDSLISVYRNYLRAHVAMYDAIKEHDTIDADRDGNPADVGLTLNVVEWKGAYKNQWNDTEIDAAAAQRMKYLYHYLYLDSLKAGTFDPDLDQSAKESYPDWKGKIDWLGIQYYFHAGVTGRRKLIPRLELMICQVGFEVFGGCGGRAKGMNKWVPTMDYEYDEVGIYTILTELSNRYPELPMVVTETGIAANNGRRRAENIVRTFEQMQRAIDEGVDLRGYYHWSLTDNFEWHLGFGPHFGLYSVDLDTFKRSPSMGATVYKEIIAERKVTAAQREEFGGVGAMTPETTELVP